jgi:hypothetical protein
MKVPKRESTQRGKGQSDNVTMVPTKDVASEYCTQSDNAVLRRVCPARSIRKSCAGEVGGSNLEQAFELVGGSNLEQDRVKKNGRGRKRRGRAKCGTLCMRERMMSDDTVTESASSQSPRR